MSPTCWLLGVSRQANPVSQERAGQPANLRRTQKGDSREGFGSSECNTCSVSNSAREAKHTSTTHNPLCHPPPAAPSRQSAKQRVAWSHRRPAHQPTVTTFRHDTLLRLLVLRRCPMHTSWLEAHGRQLAHNRSRGEKVCSAQIYVRVSCSQRCEGFGQPQEVWKLKYELSSYSHDVIMTYPFSCTANPHSKNQHD